MPREVLGLVMDEEVDVAESRCAAGCGTDPGEWQQLSALTCTEPFLRRLDGVAAGAIIERRQDDQVDFLFENLQRLRHHQRVSPTARCSP
jgi:hypothetical protein